MYQYVNKLFYILIVKINFFNNLNSKIKILSIITIIVVRNKLFVVVIYIRMKIESKLFLFDK